MAGLPGGPRRRRGLVQPCGGKEWCAVCQGDAGAARAWAGVDRLEHWVPLNADGNGDMNVYCTACEGPYCGEYGLLYASRREDVFGHEGPLWHLFGVNDPLLSLLDRPSAIDKLFASIGQIQTELLPTIAIANLRVEAWVVGHGYFDTGHEETPTLKSNPEGGRLAAGGGDGPRGAERPGPTFFEGPVVH